MEKEINKIQLELSKTKSEEELKNVSQAGITEEINQKFVTLSEMGNAVGTKPTQLKLPDGTIIPVKTWTDVLSQCISFSLEHNANVSIPFKDAAGRKVNLVGLTRPPRGITYFEDEYQGHNIFVYTNYDSNNCIRNSLHILEHTPNEYVKNVVSVIYSKQQ